MKNFAKNKQLGELYPIRNIGEQLFISLESEREKLAGTLQDDICQLIAIAKMRLPGNAETEVNTYLTIALNKLRLLAFELKPQVLEHFGLSTALNDLLNKRIKVDVNHWLVNLNQLPAGMGLIETAIFRLVQGILDNVPYPEYYDFGLEIKRIDNYICLKTSFKENISANGVWETTLFKEQLLKTVQPILYCFNGHSHFKVSDNYVEFTVCLNEEEKMYY